MRCITAAPPPTASEVQRGKGRDPLAARSGDICGTKSWTAPFIGCRCNLYTSL